MNLALLVPAALAALVALLLPLLIHLARRSEQRPVVFAALRWLRPRPKPRARLRFDEWPLLLVRLLLLALLALLLAAPVLFGAADTAPRVLVAPGATLPRDREAAVPDARWHWLAPGFPALDARPEPPAAATDASITSLLREFDAQLPADAPLTVLVPPVLDSVDAERPVLTRAVEWRVVDGTAPPPRRTPAVAPPAIVVRRSAEDADAARYLLAAHLAWQPARGGNAADVAGPEAPLPPAARVLAWLVPGAVPERVLAWTRDGGTLVLDADAPLPESVPTMVALWRDDGASVVLEGASFGRGRMLRFTRPLDPAAWPALLDGTFPTDLRAAIAPPAPAPARVSAAAHAPDRGAASSTPPPRDLAPWLVLAILLLFGIERVLATGARGRAAP